jgi:hypothetical protein
MRASFVAASRAKIHRTLWLIASAGCAAFVILVISAASANRESIGSGRTPTVAFTINGLGVDHNKNSADVYFYAIENNVDDKTLMGSQFNASTDFSASVPQGTYRFTFRLVGRKDCVVDQVTVAKDTTVACTFT